jgi:hypothetical protein
MSLAVVVEQTHVSESWRVALVGGVTGLAWALGYIGVRRARWGDVPDWEEIYAPFARLMHWRARPHVGFAPAPRAHEWLEWRIWGRILPFLTVSLLPTVFAWPLMIHTSLVAVGWLGILAIPVLGAFVAGLPGGGKSLWVKSRTGLSTMIATMPIDNAALLRATLKVSAFSSLATWAITWMFVALVVCGAFVTQRDFAAWSARACSHFLEDNDPAKSIVGCVAIAVGLFVWTWKRTLNSHLLGLLGRGWIMAEIGVWFVGYVLWCLISESFNLRPGVMLISALWLLALSRLAVACLALRAGLRRGLLSPRTASRGVAIWLMLVAVLLGVFAWANQVENITAWHLALFVVSIVPMARLAAAPLLLARIRHQ